MHQSFEEGVLSSEVNEMAVVEGPSPISFFDFSENLAFGVYQVDSNGKFTYCNEAMVDILGFSKKEDLIGRDILDFYIYKDDRPLMLDYMRVKGKSNEITLYWKAKDGKELLLKASCQFMHDDSGAVVGICGLVKVDPTI